MQNIASWLNFKYILLGIGAIFILAIVFSGLRRRQQSRRNHMPEQNETSGQVLGLDETSYDDEYYDDEREYLGAVREVDLAPPYLEDPSFGEPAPVIASTKSSNQCSQHQETDHTTRSAALDGDQVLVVYSMANADKPYVGYELLQSLLTAGLRYGKMQIFHRFEGMNTQGRVIFSVANNQAPGSFDIQQMGGVSCNGLCFFLTLGAAQDNKKALDLMLETAYQISEDLAGQLIDFQGQVFDADAYAAYYLKIKHYEQCRNEAHTVATPAMALET